MRNKLCKLSLLFTIVGQSLSGQFWSHSLCKANPNLSLPNTQRTIRKIGQSIRNGANAQQFLSELRACYRDNRFLESIIKNNLIPEWQKRGIWLEQQLIPVPTTPQPVPVAPSPSNTAGSSASSQPLPAQPTTFPSSTANISSRVPASVQVPLIKAQFFDQLEQDIAKFQQNLSLSIVSKDTITDFLKHLIEAQNSLYDVLNPQVSGELYLSFSLRRMAWQELASYCQIALLLITDQRIQNILASDSAINDLINELNTTVKDISNLSQAQIVNLNKKQQELYAAQQIPDILKQVAIAESWGVLGWIVPGTPAHVFLANLKRPIIIDLYKEKYAVFEFLQARLSSVSAVGSSGKTSLLMIQIKALLDDTSNLIKKASPIT